MVTTISFDFDTLSPERAEALALIMANAAGETNFAHGWSVTQS